MKDRIHSNGQVLLDAQTDCLRYRGAFTLIELLVTIAIIGVLAALVLPLSGIATTKMRIARVKAELNRYVNAIENYKLETGEYPPDHGLLAQTGTNDMKLYRTRAALNPLYYELSGAIFKSSGTPEFVPVSEDHPIDVNSYDRAFKRRGIRNSARVKSEIDFKGFTVKESQYEQVDPRPMSLSPGVVDVHILKVPVPGHFTLENEKKGKFNPWFYDASSTNRNNKTSYDFWAEIVVQGRTNVIGNWKN